MAVLQPSQLAMVAARVRSVYDAQAKARKVESGKEHGRGKVPENLPEPIPRSDARDAAGKAVGVSGKTVDFATRVLAQGAGPRRTSGTRSCWHCRRGPSEARTR